MADWEHFYNSFRKPGFIPGYEIQNRLGGGAFGDVYKARKQSIGKVYAIKFLKLDETTQREVVERELEQVRHFASIDHPHLVTIEDMGVVEDVPYLIMGYAGEDTLARRLKRGDLDLASAMRFFVQASRGVLALHDRRLAHFDLKPGNVFIKGDVARVGDYGLAKLLADGRQTLSFGRGTPQYMAPEMLKNRADHRADIYSLGVILFESLAHRLPFEDESGFGVIVREEDEPPEFPDDFPAPVRSVVERALRLDPDQRYDSINDLLAELGQSARQGESVLLSWDASGDSSGAAASPATTTSRRSDAPRSTGGKADEGSSELKRAAAELVRGAVVVARGVWDGVSRGGRDQGPAGSSGSRTPADAPLDVTDPDPFGGEAAAGGPVGEVVSLNTLDEGPDPLEERPPEPIAFGAGRGARRTDPLAAAVAAASADLEVSVAPIAPGGAGASGAGAGMIPVPPRIGGGLVGTVISSLILGVEVMISLVGGPVLFALRKAVGFVDRGVRSVPGALGRLLKVALLLLALGLAGAITAVVVILVMSGTV